MLYLVAFSLYSSITFYTALTTQKTSDQNACFLYFNQGNLLCLAIRHSFPKQRKLSISLRWKLLPIGCSYYILTELTPTQKESPLPLSKSVVEGYNFISVSRHSQTVCCALIVLLSYFNSNIRLVLYFELFRFAYGPPFVLLKFRISRIYRKNVIYLS